VERLDGGHLPAVGAGNRLNHRETKPGSPPIPAPSIVEPHEPLEDPLSLVGGYRITIVGHDHDRFVPLAAGGDPDSGSGMAERIVEQVAKQLAQPVGIGLL